MKKLSLALTLLFAATPGFSANGTLSVAAAVGSTSTSQQVDVSQGTAALGFNPFTMTFSKGVSAMLVDDTTNIAIKVFTKHKESTKTYGGTTKGGAVAECTSTANAANADITTAPAAADATCPTN